MPTPASSTASAAKAAEHAHLDAARRGLAADDRPRACRTSDTGCCGIGPRDDLAAAPAASAAGLAARADREVLAACTEIIASSGCWR